MSCLFSLAVAFTRFPVRANWYTDSDISPYNYFASTVVVPKVPSKEWATLFLWPGLSPIGGKNLRPIGYGVLQPVLTFGSSCAPNRNQSPAQQLKKWWISAVYVNIDTELPGYKGCHGGDGMEVNVGDKLRLVLELDNKIWTQTVVNLSNKKKTVTYSIAMNNQGQGWAEWVIESVNDWHRNPPQFTVTDIELRTGNPNPDYFCVYAQTVFPVPGASLRCADATFPKPNICKVSKCVFNIPKK
eukprot:NODE_397_length_9427_cov_0.309605.p5 type:complete len:243 gc:universal NODE_397_length_9427_cov_0.309605:5500-6228(+)